MKLRIALVGLGTDWDQRYRPALRALSDRFEIRAVYDQVGHKAAQVAREFEAVPSDGFRAVCRREDIDGVMVLSLQWTGILPILAASEAGKSVYCGDPLEISLEEIDQIQRHTEQSGIAFVSELPRRYAPATLRLKELIATRLGQPKLLFCHLRQHLDKPNRRKLPWTNHHLRNSSQVELMQLVDWCRYVVGKEPTSLVSVAHQGGLEAKKPQAGESLEDYRMISLDFSEPEDVQAGKFGSGPVAQISCGRYVPQEWVEAVSFNSPSALQVVCERGIAFVDLPARITWFDQAGRHIESLDDERPVGERLLLWYYRSVMSLVRLGKPAEDARRAIALVQEAERSHQSGERIIF
ncbi:Dehydrogenase [Planctomycetales bacterium 10988]|nr:Dehydrogenase [Planctomycetales bacterium 10988]